VDCFPFLTIIQEHARIVHTTMLEGGDTPAGATPVVTLEAPPPERGVVQPATTVAGIGGHHQLHGLGHFTTESESGTGDEIARLSERSDLESVVGGNALELQITDGPLEGTTVTVGEEGARVGRHTSNTLVIPEAGISRYHCEFRFIDGEFCVRDLGSTTGTYFYMRPYGHFKMFMGLMIKLGETEFQVLSQVVNGDDSPEQIVLFYEGLLAGHKVHVPASGITIGRRHNNNLVLVQDGTVSAHHATIFFEDGDFYICDLGSCNGTCVRLSAERTESDWHPIMNGDIVGAGCTKIRCQVHRR